MREIMYDNYYWQNDLIRLRSWSEDDWEWDYHLSFDTKSARFGSYMVDLPVTVSDCEDYSKRVANLSVSYNRITFAIETLDRTHVGRINILLDAEKNGTFGIGISVANEHKGKGYGTSAMKMLLKYAFMEKRLNKYTSTVLEGNKGSIAMHKKLGCDQEGRCKQNVYTNGRYYDEIYFGLTKEDYLKGIGCDK